MQRCFANHWDILQKNYLSSVFWQVFQNSTCPDNRCNSKPCFVRQKYKRNPNDQTTKRPFTVNQVYRWRRLPVSCCFISFQIQRWLTCRHVIGEEPTFLDIVLFVFFYGHSPLKITSEILGRIQLMRYPAGGEGGALPRVTEWRSLGNHNHGDERRNHQTPNPNYPLLFWMRWFCRSTS